MSLLSVRNVGHAFSGLRVLDDVSLDVEAGSIVGLIGPNGAGKTTLFNVIAGFIHADSGTVEFTGHDTSRWTTQKLARAGLGRTFQLMRPFASMNVIDNLTTACLSRHHSVAAARESAEGVLERIGLTADARVRSSELSTAGKKRLELGRALALEPRVLLLDEVLSGLVPSERAPLIELLRDLRGDGLGMLFVEHLMAAVMDLSDSLVVLHHGEVLASGTPQDVTSDPAVIEAYLGEEIIDVER